MLHQGTDDHFPILNQGPAPGATLTDPDCPNHSCRDAVRETNERLERLSLQTRVGLQLLRNDEPEKALETALRFIADAFDSPWCALWLASPGGEMYSMNAVWHAGSSMKHMLMASRQIITKSRTAKAGPLTRAATQLEPLWIADYSAEATDRVWAAKKSGLRNWIGVPLMGFTAAPGVMELFPNSPERPDQGLLDSLSVVSLKLGRYVERVQVTRALKDSERRYRLMFDDNPCPMLVMGWPNLNFLAVNREARNLYGYTEAEFLTLSGRDIATPESLPELLNGHRRALLRDGPKVRASHSRHLSRDGRAIDVELTQYRIDWQGRQADLVMIADVTERLAVGRQRDEMEVQLRHAHKLEAIGQLAAGIAHEINTPSQYVSDNLRFMRKAFDKMSLVLGRCEALVEAGEAAGAAGAAQDKVVDAAAQDLAQLAAVVRTTMKDSRIDYLTRELPAAIQQSIDGLSHISSIVAAMKEFSHPSHKEKSLADLNRAISSTIAISRNEWKYCADLETELDPLLPQVQCLVGEINQVMLNLIVNAAHAIQDKLAEGEKGLITVRSRHDGEAVELQVQDTGGGIPEHVRGRIFDPFFTTKDVGRGTGQGLAIARSIIVDKHNGTIHFTTTPGEGTTFFVRIPVTAP